MLYSLGNRLNFRLDAGAYKVADYGTRRENGSFTGFAGLLQRGEVDIVATDLTVTLQVQELSDVVTIGL